MASSSCSPSRRGENSLSGTNDATATKTANAAPPPSLSQFAESFISFRYDAQTNKHPDRFYYGCFVRRRLFFILLSLLTGSCDGMKSTTTHHVLPVNNIIHGIHHDNSLRDTNDDHRMTAATEKNDVKHTDGSRLLQQNCAYNQNDIKKAIRLNRTKIDLCSSNITIKSTISVISKYINVTCNLKITNGDKCTLDAQGLSRHFDTYNATINLYDIIFINGNSSDYGGATYINKSSVTMYRCDFINNYANDGGGAIASYDSTIILTGKKTKATVANNNVVGSTYSAGGFLYALNSMISITNHMFLGNSAQYFGGAIYLEFSSFSTYVCNFMNNNAYNGGVIGSYGSTLIMTGGKTKAAVAEYNGANNYGGVLYTIFCTIDITNHLFQNNYAGQLGGAIDLGYSSTLYAYRCDFMNNYANDGGAIASSGSTITLTAGEAEASMGENNYANDAGGFLSASNSVINVTNLLFRNNYAGSSGGAINIDQSSTLSTYGCDFMHNNAQYYGGAIYSYDSTLILTGGEAKAAVAENNQASYYGGFLVAINSIINVTNHLFLKNSAWNNFSVGGAMNIESSTVFAYRCDFINNSGGFGGAIQARDSTLSLIGGEAQAVVAENNVAPIFGGFLMAINASISVTNHLLHNNSARSGGASFQLNGTSYYENAIFQNNSALKQGAAFALGFEDMTLRNVVFQDNNAINGTIRSYSSQIDFKNYSFLSSDPTTGPCNLFVTQLNITLNEFLDLIFAVEKLANIDVGSPLLDSCINFPTISSINNRRLNTKSIQAHSHQDLTIFDPNDQTYPSDNLVLTTNTSSETHLSMPDDKPLQRMMTTCVSSSAGLQSAVRSANPRSGTPTKISVCTPKISLGSRARRLQDGNRSLVTNILDGIDISNKNIVLVCKRRRNGRCTLDAGGMMRHFYGSDAKVQFHKIRFINGYHEGAGGALLINNSDINLATCSFWNNTALSGAGAVFVNQATLIINGTKTNVSQNGGSGSPIEVHSSNATVQNVTFADNAMSQFGDGIFVFKSDVNLLNLSFNQSSPDMSSNCNLFVSVNSSDPAASATCVAL